MNAQSECPDMGRLCLANGTSMVELDMRVSQVELVCGGAHIQYVNGRCSLYLSQRVCLSSCTWRFLPVFVHFYGLYIFMKECTCGRDFQVLSVGPMDSNMSFLHYSGVCC